jgi:hypothetical protein
MEAVMLKLRFSLSALFAGLLLFAMPVIDLLLGGGSPGLVHAVVGSFGLALFALSAVAADVGR